MDNLNSTSDKPKSNQRDAFLVVNQQVIPLLKEITTLGRNLDNDVVIHEDFLSRYHAEVVLENEQYVIYDKDSTGGTYVNGKKIDHWVLNSGDLIALVNIQIMFVENSSNLASKSAGMTRGLEGSHSER